jgi:hypothetical protein
LSDAWLAKYSPTGDLLWNIKIHMYNYGQARAIATDNDGNVYISGELWSHGDAVGQTEVWLSKYSRSGNSLWRRQIGYGESSNYSTAVATDRNGNVYLTTETCVARCEPRLLKYCARGKQLWVRRIAASDDAFAQGIASDGNGNIYVAGWTRGSLGGPNRGLEDAWLAKYSPAGVSLWKRQIGTKRSDDAYGTATDSNGNVYIAGRTTGSLGGPNQGQSDAWVAKYSSAGALRWRRQVGTSETELAYGVATDRDGNVYSAGETGGSLGGPNQGQTDAWVVKYSVAGLLRWKRQLGTAYYDGVSGVATDGRGNVYIAGSTGGSLGGPIQGDLDAWLAQYSRAGDRTQ